VGCCGSDWTCAISEDRSIAVVTIMAHICPWDNTQEQQTTAVLIVKTAWFQVSHAKWFVSGIKLKIDFFNNLACVF
jgi:hypothetical protein